MSLACRATCIVNGLDIDCEVKAGHDHEHEATLLIVAGDDQERDTPFLVWWGSDGHAFVGSDKAVDTGNIA